MKSDFGLCPVYIKLPPENIAELKFILESYEGLAEVRTLQSDKGEVVLLTVGDMLERVMELLNALRLQLGVRVVSRPDLLRDDWLL